MTFMLLMVYKAFMLISFYCCLAMVDTLVAKTRAWEEERGVSFAYDGVVLLAMLEEYAMLRQEREEEKRRLRVRLSCMIINFVQAQLNSRNFYIYCLHLNCFILALNGFITLKLLGSKEVP